MAQAKGTVQQLLARAHSPDTANQIFADKIQFRPLLLRPTSPPPGLPDAGGGGDATTAAAAAASGHSGREIRRRSRRIKQEQRRARQPKPRPLSSRQRKKLGLYEMVPKQQPQQPQQPQQQKKTAYATFVPLHRLWLGYIREVLGPQDLREGGPGAAAKLAAADFHGADVEVTRSTCVGRVGIRGIVVRDTRHVFEIVTPGGSVKMVPKEGTFFRVEIPLEEAEETTTSGGDGDENAMSVELPSPSLKSKPPVLAAEILGSHFMHRAADRANRKFKQHFFKTI